MNREFALQMAVDMAKREPGLTPGATLELAQEFADFLAGNTTDVDNPRRGGRKAKDEPTGDKAPLEPAAGNEPTTSTTASGAESNAGGTATTETAPKDEPAAMTLDAIREKATLFTQDPNGGTTAFGSILEQMGAAKLSEVPAERYADLATALDDHLAGGGKADPLA